MTRSPIELFWTAKKKFQNLCTKTKVPGFAIETPILILIVTLSLVFPLLTTGTAPLLLLKNLFNLILFFFDAPMYLQEDRHVRGINGEGRFTNQFKDDLSDKLRSTRNCIRNLSNIQPRSIVLIFSICFPQRVVLVRYPVPCVCVVWMCGLDMVSSQRSVICRPCFAPSPSYKLHPMKILVIVLQLFVLIFWWIYLVRYWVELQFHILQVKWHALYRIAPTKNDIAMEPSTNEFLTKNLKSDVCKDKK